MSSQRPRAASSPRSRSTIEFLGDTIDEDRREKAGIFKRGVPAIVAPQTTPRWRVIEREAERVGAPLLVGGQDCDAREEHGRLVYQDEDGLLDLPLPRLAGRHQYRQCRHRDRRAARRESASPHAAYRAGLTRAEWPARLQRLTAARLPALAPAGAEIWLDGGHNADGGRALAQAMADFEEKRRGR